MSSLVSRASLVPLASAQHRDDDNQRRTVLDWYLEVG